MPISPNLKGPGQLNPIGMNPRELLHYSGNDPVCAGSGFLWETPYFQVTCWRCAGTGNLPNLVQPKQSGKIANQGEAVGEGIDGTAISNQESTNEGNQQGL